MSQQQPQYLIVSLEHTQVGSGCVAFLRPDRQGVTHSIDEAGRYDEDVVNADLGFYDDGQHCLAVLSTAVEKHVSPVVLLTELTSGALKRTNNEMRGA